jgi:hypothetical protein
LELLWKREYSFSREGVKLTTGSNLTSVFCTLSLELFAASNNTSVVNLSRQNYTIHKYPVIPGANNTKICYNKTTYNNTWKIIIHV